MQKRNWTPPELLKMSDSYWEACTLHAGVKLDLFTSLVEKPATAAGLACRLGLDARGLSMLLDALAALELLVKQGENYQATPFAQQFLASSSPAYLGHIILHHHHLVDAWGRLDQAVRSGEPVRRRVSHDSEQVKRESFLLGMFNLAMQLAPHVASQIDLADRKHLLDLGGGPGTYAIHFCQRNPRLQATVFDLPSTRPIAEQTIARFHLQDRIRFVGGDFQHDSLRGRYDAAWLSHVLHGEGATECAVMLQKTADVLEPGGLLMVQEFILEDSRDRPLFPALFSLNMLLGTRHGKAYSSGEITSLLSSAGLQQIRQLPMDLPKGAGVICGRKPT